MANPKCILIKHATILSMDQAIGNVSNCDNLIKEDMIAAVGLKLSIPEDGDCKTIDCRDRLWHQRDLLLWLLSQPPILAHPSEEHFEDFTQELHQRDAAHVLKEQYPDNNPKTSLLTFGIAPNELGSTAIEDIKEELKRSCVIGARVITCHVAMDHYDRAHQKIVQGLANDNLLWPDIVFSHGASPTEGELRAIKESSAGIVATPDTELQMGMNHPVAFRAAENGCRSCLSIHITSNNSNDFMAQMRLALKAQRAKDNEENIPKVIRQKMEEVLYDEVEVILRKC
ncbi:hypothetical protein HBI33_137140 [Parastagonospora nodorum]|nr:hypothetical protein HBI33_137140 [Parastagonospora nodorum]